ncbi:hypothetical protein VNO77_03657 [Canavalia gladiata]|uniref:Uncharacterized protein n=1 Tax=Canavalia gladiata TaxID=3824 RepID=A0AAN9MVQ3_CANGL
MQFHDLSYMAWLYWATTYDRVLVQERGMGGLDPGCKGSSDDSPTRPILWLDVGHLGHWSCTFVGAGFAGAVIDWDSMVDQRISSRVMRVTSKGYPLYFQYIQDSSTTSNDAVRGHVRERFDLGIVHACWSAKGDDVWDTLVCMADSVFPERIEERGPPSKALELLCAEERRENFYNPSPEHP